MRNRDKERAYAEQSSREFFLSIYRKFRDCLAVHSGANVVSVFFFLFLFVFKPLLGYLNYFDTETVVVAVGTGDGAVTTVTSLSAAASVFSGGAVPGNAELCPGIEYCGLN